MHLYQGFNKNFIRFMLIFELVCFVIGQYRKPYRCITKLDTALDHMLRINQMKSGSRTHLELSPYSVYQSLYGNSDDHGDHLINNPKLLNEKINEFYDDNDESSPLHDDRRKLSITKVEIADLTVRLPSNMRWVHVDKCHFIANNRTLDTRLLFPDLTISGKVIMHPTGGHCNMILRLRRAGIEFRTIPLGSPASSSSSSSSSSASMLDESRRNGGTSVRTDSHFSEPGFLSVFAHGCQGPSGTRLRQNSKRRYFDRERERDSSNRLNGRNYDGGSPLNDKDQHMPTIDKMNFDNDILDYATDDSDQRRPAAVGAQNARTFSEIFGFGFGAGTNPKRFNGTRHYAGPQHTNNHWYNAEAPSSDEINEALSLELEQLFSMGVRGLLTTYMQKALQPAIKETLMENMGYTLSYG